MPAAFPPSSRCMGLGPAPAAMLRPTDVEPVKEIIEMSAWEARTSPISLPGPVITLSTPAGSPASSKTRANRTRGIGASDGALATTVFPAASAGMIFDATRNSG